MEPNITIERTNPFHLREMSQAMSSDSIEIAKGLGTTPLRALWASYRKSVYCKSIFIGNEIVAIFGLAGSIFGDTGNPWLICAPAVEDYPFRTAFVYKRELQEMQKMFPVLEEYVPADNEKSIRLLTLMGFKVSKNKVQVGDIAYYQAERRIA